MVHILMLDCVVTKIIELSLRSKTQQRGNTSASFLGLSAWCGCWVCCLYQEVYLQTFLNVCPFDCRLLRGVGRWARKPVNHTIWVDVVTPTDRPKSVRNRRVIEPFVALFVLSLYPFVNFVGIGAFVIGLSQISSFFLFLQ